jgi:hypothetical protein
MKMSPIQK